MFREVRKNKFKTTIFISGFMAFTYLFVLAIGYFFNTDTVLINIIGLSVSILSSIFTYYNCDKMVLSLNKARIATKEEYLQLNNSLEGLCIAANLPVPRLYVIDDNSMNAFATGRNPSNAVICVTKGLINNLDKYEMEGVLAHELSHIKNYDILLSTIVIIMVGFISIISDMALRSNFRRSNSNDKEDSQVAAILMLLSLVFIILSPIISQIIQLAISRNREYLADASAIELTRNKDGLINALKKLENNNNTYARANATSASLYIVNPFANKRQKDSWFSTHPNTANRIKRLETIQ